MNEPEEEGEQVRAKARLRQLLQLHADSDLSDDELSLNLALLFLQIYMHVQQGDQCINDGLSIISRDVLDLFANWLERQLSQAGLVSFVSVFLVDFHNEGEIERKNALLRPLCDKLTHAVRNELGAK